MLPLLALAVPVLGVAAITKFHLRGEDLSRYDGQDVGTLFFRDEPSKGAKAVEQYLTENFIKPAQSKNEQSTLAAKRARFETAGMARKLTGSTFTPVTIQTDEGEMDGAWTTTKTTDPSRRILYLHGGGMTVGSAVSHSAICHNLAVRTGCAVFAPNYRLMPEHSRQDIIDDARAAYRWIAGHGPDGASAADKIVVAGDSAGGNLTLMLGNWFGPARVRKADALVALSANTDCTFTAPSIADNFETDLMLQPLAAPLMKMPKSVLLWAGWKQLGIKPSAPEVSPIFGPLDDLPPTLLQVSDSEMMRDDSLRYAAKAREAGSDVTLQVWNHVPHVWHMFDNKLEEAVEALDEIATWLKAQGI